VDDIDTDLNQTGMTYSELMWCGTRVSGTLLWAR